jgi:acetylglutamate kinase
VDTGVLGALWAGGFIPVVASLAADRAGAIYNVNADTIATSLALALAADGLLLLTNVPGILRDAKDPATRIPECDEATVAALISDGTIGGGMLPKVQGALEALRAGVARVQILDGTQPHTLRDSFAAGGSGTIIRGAARPLAPTTSGIVF